MMESKSLKSFVMDKLDEDNEMDAFSDRATQLIYTLAERTGIDCGIVEVKVYPNEAVKGEISRLQCTVGGLFVAFINGTPADDMLNLMSLSEYANGEPRARVQMGTTPEFFNGVEERLVRSMSQVWQSILHDYGYVPIYDPSLDDEDMARFGTIVPSPCEVAFNSAIPSVRLRMEYDTVPQYHEAVVYNNDGIRRF